VTTPAGWDSEAIRSRFVFAQTGRCVTNNAASTQVPRELDRAACRVGEAIATWS